uniref:Uncharacterized protein n=1 Tax=Lactuca sativa TaxID=4236 RepID=A0A9R1WVT3_LACSA|nr:hypothetical protein LSAT_V11C800433700 [Lactuca sativa]
MNQVQIGVLINKITGKITCQVPRWMSSKACVLNSYICLSFKHPELGYVMELGDETDVLQLTHVMSESKKMVHLYLTVVGEEAKEQAVVNN